VTAIVGWSTVPAYGVLGAALTATAAYFVGWVYQAVRFMRHSGASFGDLFPNGRDLAILKSVLVRVSGRIR
jgi:Na+-driven multidrug efflux pump